jgi:hypothetical protein
MAPGATTTYFLTVQVNNCIGAGITIPNTATIFTDSIDPDSSNDSSSVSFTTTEDGTCHPLLCDPSTCILDQCQVDSQGNVGGTCNAGACESVARVCNDNSVCTADSCDSATGCVFDSSQLGDLCDDFIDCTLNTCDPVLFCQFPPVPAGVGCSDGLNCTTSDACDGTGNCVGTSVCNDGNPCTDDFADEGNNCACSYAPTAAGFPCSDNNACTGPDACDGQGACVGGAAVNCDDGNACTNDSCDTALGCVHTPLNCDDGNACNGVETCNPSSGCVPGTPLSCDDGNACNGLETCSPASGCVPGTPVVCAPPDQCHAAGVCNPGTGVCSYANLPDGTTCDDGNASTSGDSCQGGVCVGAPCTSSNDPKTKGWYRSLCTSGGHSGDAITDADAACVGALTTTFGGITTAAQVCAVLNPSHNANASACAKAEDWFMALALNICKQRVCPQNTIDSMCGNNQTVGQSLAQADALLSNPSRTDAQCWDANCLSSEIDTGHALELDTVTALRETGNIRLSWVAPATDDTMHPKSYKVWRRAVGSLAPFVQIGSTTGTTYLDLTAGTGSWQYDVTPVF